MKKNILTNIYYARDRFLNGIAETMSNKAKTIILTIYSFMFILWILPKQKAFSIFEDSSGGTIFLKIILFTIGLVVLLYIYGAPIDAVLVDMKLAQIGLMNRWDETPHLIKRVKEENVEKWLFYASGVSMEDWDRAANKLESALNMIYVKSEYEKDREHIFVYLVPPDKDVPHFVEWKNEFINPDSNILCLGIGTIGPVELNLEITPHVLVGGGSNCGKSILLNALINQCVCHGDSVIIADRKGGVDYVRLKHFCGLVTDEKEFIDILKSLSAEREHRQILLRQSGCSNMTEYNKKHNEKLKRIVLVIDEVAEWLDKTGSTKEQKQIIDNIIGYLSSLARLGRATNISLILSQQRPDASVLPGQIKAQCSYRIAGRCDNVLSQIILDSTMAAEKIPFDERGLFINGEGTLFRGFYITNKQIGRY